MCRLNLHVPQIISNELAIIPLHITSGTVLDLLQQANRAKITINIIMFSSPMLMAYTKAARQIY
jgi:hypothetical protein